MSSYGIKQLDIIKNIGRCKRELHVGVYGCGKTYSISVALGILSLRLRNEGVTGLNIVLLGKTQQTVKKNICNVLSDNFGKDFRYDSGRKDGKTKDGVLFDQYIHIIGLNDKSSEGKFRGLSNIFCIIHDEAVLCSEEQFNKILGRLRGSFSNEAMSTFNKLSIVPCFYIGSTNPDSPVHWLKHKIDDNYFDKVINWHIDDAKWKGAREYYDNLLKAYPEGSIDRQRYLQCKWVAAEGIIFKYFLENKDKFIVDDVDEKSIGYAVAGIDIGGHKSGSTIVISGFHGNISEGITVLHSAKLIDNKGTIDADRLNVWIMEQIDIFRSKYDSVPIVQANVDNAEQYIEAGIRNALRRNGYNITVADAKKILIMDRVKFIQKMFAVNMLHIHSDCNDLIKSLSTLVYDEKKLKDTVLDDGNTDNDSFDAFCYSFEKQISRFSYV